MNRRDFLKGLLATAGVVVATPELLAQAGVRGKADVIWFPTGFRLDMPAKPDCLFLNGILLHEGGDPMYSDYHATDKAVVFLNARIREGDIVAISFYVDEPEWKEKSQWDREIEEVSLLQAIKKAYEQPVYVETVHLAVGNPRNPLP